MPRLKKCLGKNQTRKLQLTGEKDAIEPEDINDNKERVRGMDITKCLLCAVFAIMVNFPTNIIFG